MNHDEAWQERVRAAFAAPEEDGGQAAARVASRAIDAGTTRLAARGSTRAATLGLFLALGALAGAYGWAASETARAAETTLRNGAPWTP
jgi:hypothetical protein